MADIERDIVLRVKSETEQAQGQFKNLKQELRSIENQLNQMAESGDTGSKAFQQLQRRAGEVKDQLGDTKAAIKALSSDTFKLDAFSQAAQGIAGGFAAAQGAMSLFGSENKAVEEAIKKTQGAMALLQGVTAITNILQKETAFSAFFLGRAQQANTVATEGAAVATKGFSKALIATGIGAIIVAIGTLIAYWDDLSEAIGLTNTELDITKKAVESIGDTFGKERAEVEKLTYEYEQQNTSAKRKQEIIAELEKISPNYFGTLDKEKTSIEQLTTAQNKFNTALTKQALLKGYQKQLEELGNAQAKINTELETGTKEASGFQQFVNFLTAGFRAPVGGAEVLNTIDAVKGANKELAQNQKQIDATLKLIAETEAELNKLGGEAIVEDKKDKKPKVKGKTKEELQKEAEKIAKEQRDFEEKERKLSLEADKQYLDASLANDRFTLDKKLELNKEYFLNGTISEKEYLDNINRLKKEQADKEEKASKDAQDKAKEQREFEDKERQMSLDADLKYLNDSLESTRLSLEKKKQLLKDSYLSGIISQKEYNEAIQKLELSSAQKRKEIFDFIVRTSQQTFSNILAFRENQMNQELQMAKGNEKEQERIRKEYFERNKKVQIAEAIIQAIAGAQGAFTQTAKSPITSVFPGAPYIAAASALATGLANVQKIRQSQFQGGSASSSSSNNIGANVPTQPSQNSQNTPGINSTMLNLDAQGNLRQGPARTYVVESEISDKQRRSRQLSQTAILGK